MKFVDSSSNEINLNKELIGKKEQEIGEITKMVKNNELLEEEKQKFQSENQNETVIKVQPYKYPSKNNVRSRTFSVKKTKNHPEALVPILKEWKFLRSKWVKEKVGREVEIALHEYDYVVIGAGLSGTLLAYFLGRTRNAKVLMLERKDQVGGSLLDFFTDDKELISPYGAKFVQTNNDLVQMFINLFPEDWRPYEHRTLIRTNQKVEKFSVLPVTIDTVNYFYDKKIRDPETFSNYLKTLNSAVNGNPLLSFREYMEDVIGKDLWNKIGGNETGVLFSDTTKLSRDQWKEYENMLTEGLYSFENILRNNFDRRASQADHQWLPVNGYSSFIEKLLDHKNIDVYLGVDYNIVRKEIENHFKSMTGRIFYTGKIDQYFNYEHGKLGYDRRLINVVRVNQFHFQPSGEIFYNKGTVRRIWEPKNIPYRNTLDLDYIRAYGTTTLVFEERDVSEMKDFNEYYTESPSMDYNSLEALNLYHKSLIDGHFVRFFGPGSKYFSMSPSERILEILKYFRSEIIELDEEMGKQNEPQLDDFIEKRSLRVFLSHCNEENSTFSWLLEYDRIMSSLFSIKYFIVSKCSVADSQNIYEFFNKSSSSWDFQVEYFPKMYNFGEEHLNVLRWMIFKRGLMDNNGINLFYQIHLHRDNYCPFSLIVNETMDIAEYVISSSGRKYDMDLRTTKYDYLQPLTHFPVKWSSQYTTKDVVEREVIYRACDYQTRLDRDFSDRNCTLHHQYAYCGGSSFFASTRLINRISGVHLNVMWDLFNDARISTGRQRGGKHWIPLGMLESTMLAVLKGKSNSRYISNMDIIIVNLGVNRILRTKP